MSADAAKRPARWGINPATGHPWTLADPEIAAELDREAREMSRDDAVRFLQQIGLLTKSGNLSSRYYSKAEIEQHRRRRVRLEAMTA